MDPVTRSRLTPATVELARVLDVDITNFTLTVATQFAKKPLSGLSWASPYLHPHNGEGITCMPEVGSVCWVCSPSDGGMPFVIAWAPAQNEASFRAHRMDLNPGDIAFSTRDENFLILRRGGIVQIGATGLCQRMFFPVSNLVRDICENYLLQTLGGELEWSIGLEAENADGHRPAKLAIRPRQYADDPMPIADLQIGSHDEDEDTILSLVIRESGQKNAAAKISLSFDKKGNAVWEFKQDLNWKVGGTAHLEVQALEVEVAEDGTIHAKKQLNLSGDSGVTIGSSNGDVKLSGRKVTLDSECVVGGGTTKVLLAETSFVSFLLTHVHSVTAVGAPSGPAIDLKTLSPFTGTAHIAQKLSSA